MGGTKRAPGGGTVNVLFASGGKRMSKGGGDSQKKKKKKVHPNQVNARGEQDSAQKGKKTGFQVKKKNDF